MRIIGGRFKGRRFNPPADKWPTRPTTDFSKEALFNILVNRFDCETVKVLDLFAGTGSHSYEWISRGCTDVTCVDKFGGCIRFIQKMRSELGIEDELKVVRADVFAFIQQTGETYDYIFAGPPYPLKTIPDIPNLIFQNALLRESGLFVLEHNAAHDFSNHPQFEQLRTYGGTYFSFFT